MTSHEAGITPRVQRIGNLGTATLDVLISPQTSDLKNMLDDFVCKKVNFETLKTEIFLFLKTRSGKNRLLL